MQDEPRDVTTFCPRCGGRLVRRVARQGQRAGQAFLGCGNYPRCRYSVELGAATTRP